MGYDLRITRALDWACNLGCEIAAEEWWTLVRADAELTADPMHGPYAVRFGDAGWFDWCDGNIFTTDPEAPTVAKMLRIAESISAVVQGDEKEFYDSVNAWSRRAAKARRL